MTDPRFLDPLELISRGMNQELHWFPADVSPTRLAETLVGLANTQGGTVLIGVAPRSGELQGVPDPEATLDRIFQAALLTDPALVLPLPQLQVCEGVQIFRILVPSGLPHVYNLDGRYLGREGRQTTPISARSLRKILLERGVYHFELEIPPGVQFDDLDEEKITEYFNRLPIKESNLTPKELLLRRGCLRASEGEYLPTYAALLLFGHHPQRWLPSATILAVRYSGANFADEFLKQDIAGTIPDQLQQAQQFTADQMRPRVTLNGLTHNLTSEYPPAAIRELLVNAVAHRDYNHQGDSIHLNLFADHLEIQSPGTLPGPITVENLLTARFSRNPVLVQVLSDMGYVERLGYGLTRVMTATRAAGLPPPHFSEVGGSFRATVFSGFGAPKTPDEPLLAEFTLLNPRQQLALRYLSNQPRITNRVYQELCPDVHPETLRRDLADLVKKGLVMKVGDKRATYYILKS